MPECIQIYTELEQALFDAFRQSQRLALDLYESRAVPKKSTSDTITDLFHDHGIYDLETFTQNLMAGDMVP